MSVLDKDSSVRLRAILEIPPKTLRMFLTASIVGTWVPVSGRPGPLKPGERAVGIEIKPRQRDDVLERLSLAPKTWANAVTAWISLRLAHRCGRATVTLFTTPLHGDAAICPRCRANLATSPHRGTNVPPAGEHSSPSQGSRIAASSATTSANAVASGRWLQGEEEGGSAPTPLQKVLSKLEEDAAFERARAVAEKLKEEAS